VARPLALWRRVLSVVVGADRPASRLPAAEIRQLHPLSRRVAAIVFGLSLPPTRAKVVGPQRDERWWGKMAFAPCAGAVVVTLLLLGHIVRDPDTIGHVVLPFPSIATTTTTATDPSATASPAEASLLLRDQVLADHRAVEQLVGQWVPQISSIKLDLVINGVTFDYPEIWANYQSLRAQYPQALLLNSSDYVNFSGKDFWVTVAGVAFGTADEANAWCDQQGFAEQECYASRLMHTGGPAGNSKIR